MIPVHATVMILLFSISPQLTITAGSGAVSGPGFELIFILSFPQAAENLLKNLRKL
jgi:hypothetical protein